MDCFSAIVGITKPNLLTPIITQMTPSERRYISAQRKTRKTIDCTFVVWKNRWRYMDKTGGTLCYTPERVCRLIVATMVLHNVCIDYNLQWASDGMNQEPIISEDVDPIDIVL